MYSDVRRIRLAGRLRRAREAISDAHAELCDISLDQFSFKLTNVELELVEIHRELLEPFSQLGHATPRRPQCDYPAEELPF
jgi:hypothetical protein